jgi:hypothetical protein
MEGNPIIKRKEGGKLHIFLVHLMKNNKSSHSIWLGK